MKKKVKKESPEREILINLRISPKEKDEIQLKANQFMDGNLSAWVRFASRTFTPKGQS